MSTRGRRLFRTAGLAAVVLLVLVGAWLGRPGRIPPQATRRTPPPGIEGRALAEGALAPEFTLPGSAQEPVTLRAALAQGPVLLVFYRGHWCPFCRDQLTELQRHLPALSARAAQVMAISADAPGDTQALAQRLNLGFPLLSDAERLVIRQFGVEDAANEIAWPAVYLLDRRGVVRWRDVSIDYRDRASAVALLHQISRL